jgi:hypothetical protein
MFMMRKNGDGVTAPAFLLRRSSTKELHSMESNYLLFRAKITAQPECQKLN